MFMAKYCVLYVCIQPSYGGDPYVPTPVQIMETMI